MKNHDCLDIESCKYVKKWNKCYPDCLDFVRKHKIILLIYKDNDYITSQDVSDFRADQIAEIVTVKEECGLNCRVKRFPGCYDIQAEIGVNANNYLKGEV